MRPMRHTILRDGIVAGVLGATAVAAWFFLVDLILGRPFYTPIGLGRGLHRHCHDLERVLQAIPHQIVRPKAGGLAEVMNGLDEELKKRSGAEDAGQSSTTYLIIHGLENFKKLRQEDEFSFSSSSLRV